MDHRDFNHHRHAKSWRNFWFEYCIFVILIHLCWLLCSGLLGDSEEVWKGAEDNLQEQVQPWLWGKITTPTHSKISPPASDCICWLTLQPVGAGGGRGFQQGDQTPVEDLTQQARKLLKKTIKKEQIFHLQKANQSKNLTQQARNLN